MIISIRLSRVSTITSTSDKVVIVAVLSSSLRRAISQKISPAESSATFCHLILISTCPDLIIYHSQFDFSHSIIMISPLQNGLSSQFKMILSTTSLSIHWNIFSEYTVSVILYLLYNKVTS